MKESYLKHLTIAVIGTGLVMAVMFSPDVSLRAGAMTLLGVIIGYVFKNGTGQSSHTDRARTASDNENSTDPVRR